MATTPLKGYSLRLTVLVMYGWSSGLMEPAAIAPKTKTIGLSSGKVSAKLVGLNSLPCCEKP